MPNLRDRQNLPKSEKPSESKQPESRNSQEQLKRPPLNDTTPKSKQPSPEHPSPEQMKLIEKQSEAINKLKSEKGNLQQELEVLRAEGRPEDQEEIQTLSSEVSELTSLVQELRTQLQEQSAQITRLGSAQDELKKAEELSWKNSEKEKNLQKREKNLQSTIDKAQASADKEKQKYKDKCDDLQQKFDEAVARVKAKDEKRQKLLDEAECKEKEADRKLSEINNEIEKRAHRMVESQLNIHEIEYGQRRRKLDGDYEIKMEKLDKKYKAYTAGHDLFLLWTMSYSLLITVFGIYTQKMPKWDFIVFFWHVWKYIKETFTGGWVIGQQVVYMWDPQYANTTTAQHIGYYTILIVLTLIVWSLGYVLPGYIIGYGTYRYIKEVADKFTYKVALVSLVVCVYCGNWIRSWLPVNLVLLWIITQVVFAFARWWLKKNN